MYMQLIRNQNRTSDVGEFHSNCDKYKSAKAIVSMLVEEVEDFGNL